MFVLYKQIVSQTLSLINLKLLKSNSELCNASPSDICLSVEYSKTFHITPVIVQKGEAKVWIWSMWGDNVTQSESCHLSQNVSSCFPSHTSAICWLSSRLGGVYDSPMATDYYVRQFGFMFGGGRSGVFGLKALQVVFNSSLSLHYMILKIYTIIQMYHFNPFQGTKWTSTSNN